MQARYALRFDTGERKGEQVPVTGAGVTIGRKPGNSVQILDASVSGRHAEFAVDASGIVLRDLGSTNGTRVGGERVSERRLVHGDQVMLGNIRVTFLDTELPAPPPSSLPPGAGAPVAARASASSGGDSGGMELELEDPVEPSGGFAAGDRPPSDRAGERSGERASDRAPSERGGADSSDAVRTISADKVARSAKLSKAGALGMLLAVGIGAGGWWWIQSKQSATGAAAPRTVTVTPGNLLGEAFSFEGVEVDGEDASWANDSASAAVFSVDGGSRQSGDEGLGAVLTAGQSALVRSKLLSLSSARHFQLSAAVRTEGQASARIGLEFESSSDAAARTSAWSPAADGADFETLEWSCAVPQGFDGVRVLLAARSVGEGAVDLDDVVLLAGGESAAPLAADSFQFVGLGSPATAAVLFKIDRTLLSDLHLGSGAGERAVFAPSAVDSGFQLDLGSGPERTLVLRADGPLASAAPASLGQGGYRTHSGSFERDGLARLVLGAGKDLVALGFDAPVRVQARPEGAGLRLELALGEATRATVQVSFRTEREAALAIAREAREAERAGRFGPALAAWTRLRDDAPFDSELLAESDAARGRLAERGLAEVSALRTEVERARFFRLVELYRQCRAQGEAIAERFAGGEVETAALEVVAQVRRDLDVLEAELSKTERARLESISRALEASKSAVLAERVRKYLDERFASAGAQGGVR
jgi:pSer/pThr/pTyr-binding forkhead associated (FHA) protein